MLHAYKNDRWSKGLFAGTLLCFCAHACSLGTKSASDDGGVGAPAGNVGAGGTTAPATTSPATTVGVGGGAAQPPPLIPPPPDDEATCDELDPSKPLHLFVSPDDSNSMASAAWSRKMLNEGLTYAMPARPYEFLNYYSFDYPAPAPGELNIITQLARGAEARDFDMQIGVRSADPIARRPATITLVLDTSGSMEGEAIARERDVVEAIAASLVQGDIVNAVTWDTANNVVLEGHVVTGPNDAALISLASGLHADGGTDLHGGLTAGYQLAEQHFGANRLNRVVLISDGGANVGVTDAALIGQHAESADAEAIYLVGVGVGEVGGYSDALMDTVTDAGRGAYVFIDSEQEAQRMFTDRFTEVFEVAARAVQIELTAPWYFQMQRFYGEEYAETPTDIEPQHLAPGDAMVIHQVLRACSADEVIGTDAIRIDVTWREPITFDERTTTATYTIDQLLAGDIAALNKGRAIVTYAEALRANTSTALTHAHQLISDYLSTAGDADLLELRALLETHPMYIP